MSSHFSDPQKVLAESSRALADIRHQLEEAFPSRSPVERVLRRSRRSLRGAEDFVKEYPAQVSLGGLVFGVFAAGVAYAFLRSGSDR